MNNNVDKSLGQIKKLLSSYPADNSDMDKIHVSIKSALSDSPAHALLARGNVRHEAVNRSI